MIDLIKSKIRYKIVFSMFVLMTISAFITMGLVYYNVSNNSKKIAIKNLEMVNDAIFQSLRNAMNTGDPAVIERAEKEASSIKGFEKLKVEKSKKLIELYSPETPFTNDSNVLNVMKNKKRKIIEIDNEKGHKIRLLTPLVAKKECLMCHTNQKVGETIGVIDLTYSMSESDSDINQIVINNVIISTILGWITIGFIFWLVKYLTKPIEILHDAIKALMKFSSANQEIIVKSSDEIGDVAKSFNMYLRHIREGIKQDQLVVEEAEEVIRMVKAGFFNYKVHSSSSNRTVNDLKNSINEMIDDLNNKFQKISTALSEYGSGNFKYKLYVENASGIIESIALSADAIGNNSSEMLATILLTGEKLDKNLAILTNVSNHLSQNSNKQAAALEETAAAIEQISENINSNVVNVNEMSQLANEVSIASNKGKELAYKTANAMDEINSQVSAINEAISVIDQIAFQTNILSLNAAVEAATAGEAGKGFAVVAGEVRNLAARSAEAANEIKKLVESATIKANEGRDISNQMIDGYDILSQKIEKTKEMIDKVSTASHEQSKAIAQINNTVNELDKETQKNANEANKISELAKEVKALSDNLMSITNYVEYREEARTQVCDIGFAFKMNKLQLDHIKFKDINWADLDTNAKKQVVDHNSCALGKWIIESENSNKPFTKTANWNKMKAHHEKVHRSVQEFINENQENADSLVLVPKAYEIEKSIKNVFYSLNVVKQENCKRKEV